MFNISATELLVIAVVALLVLGPEKLPDAMRKLGRATREIRRVTSGFEAELRDALSDPIETPTPPPAPTSSDATPTSNGASAPNAVGTTHARQPDGGARTGPLRARRPGRAGVLGRVRGLTW